MDVNSNLTGFVKPILVYSIRQYQDVGVKTNLYELIKKNAIMSSIWILFTIATFSGGFMPTHVL